MKRIIWALGLIVLVGCTTVKDKLHKVETPAGYMCKTHGLHPKAYKLGTRYFCTICVDENMGQVEMVIK